MELVKKLRCILLVDDDAADNYYHRRIIQKAEVAEEIVVAENGEEALTYLTSITEGSPSRPELIFLDINMPAMDGWAFLSTYKSLPQNQKANTVIVMLTTSPDPEDQRRADAIQEISDFRNKPLDQAMLEEILTQYFPDYLLKS